jgi:Zn-dependent protease
MNHPANSMNHLQKTYPSWSFHIYPVSNGRFSLALSSRSFSSSSSKCFQQPSLGKTTREMLPRIFGGVWNSRLGETSNGHRPYFHRYGARSVGYHGVAATVLLQRTFYSSSGGGRRPPSPNSNRLWQGMGLLGSGSLLLWGKGKYLLGALKLGKLASLGSMLVTVGAYSMFFGIPYAIGMVSLITVHEAGHALVMLQRNIPFSPMVFIPFMGASIVMNRRPHDAWEDALVAFGGPALGSLGALGCSLGGYAMDSQLLYALADFGYMINLFNMLPIGMMGKSLHMLHQLSPYKIIFSLSINLLCPTHL